MSEATRIHDANKEAAAISVDIHTGKEEEAAVDWTKKHEPSILVSGQGCWWNCSCGARSAVRKVQYTTGAQAAIGWAMHLSEEARDGKL